ncbi:MAG: GAF domain-containing protein [Thermoplasmatota archaeon]
MDKRRIIDEVQGIIESPGDTDDKLQQICEMLSDEIDYYDWVGFYLVNEDKEDELELGPFVGDPTEHTNIGFGEGICGQAAESKDTYVVQDVSEEDNYLSCSVKVKSEIVVPIFKGGEIAGEIDIDSHELKPFTDEDEELLEEIAKRVSTII